MYGPVSGTHSAHPLVWDKKKRGGSQELKIPLRGIPKNSEYLCTAIPSYSKPLRQAALIDNVLKPNVFQP